MNDLHHIRIFLLTGQTIDIVCAKFALEGRSYVARGNDSALPQESEIVAVFAQDKVAGYLLVRPQKKLADQVVRLKVSAVVVSRLNHPIGEVIDSIAPHVEEIIVVRGHNGVWERWEAVARAKCEVVYVQDDDAIVDVPAVLAAHEPGKVVCNMPEDHRLDYPDGIALVGWGAVLDKDLADSNTHITPVDRYSSWDRNGVYWDSVFYRECDRVFTGLSPLKLIDVPIRHLPQAHGADRMGREPRHGADLQEIRRRIYAVRAAAK